MYSYPEFETKIATVFKDIIEENNLKTVSLSQNNFSTFQIRNNNCIIQFTYDTGEVGCVFINPRINGKEVYPVYSIWKYLFPNDKKEYGSTDWNFDVQVQHLASLIEERLTNVVNGDFSWVDGYQNKSNQLSKRIEFMVNNLSKEHSILKKFWNADKSWEADFEEYLIANNIHL